jgi:cytochrome P450
MEGLRGDGEVDRDHYAEAVVREVLRIKPVLPIVGRKLNRPARLGPYALPKGSVLMPCAYLLHRESAIYPNPDEFQPERFLGAAPGAYSWIPFGGGIRRCVGASFALLQMQTVLKLMFEKLDVEPGGRPEPIRRRSVSLAPARGGKVIATPRRTA